MRPAPRTVCLFSASTTNAATQQANVDTRGYSYAVVDCIESASNAATNNPSVLDLLEADDTNATSFVTISGFVGDTGFTIPNSVTTGVQVLSSMRVDLRGRMRYLRLRVSPVTTQVLTGLVHLYKGEEAPVSASDANCGVLVEG